MGRVLVPEVKIGEPAAGAGYDKIKCQGIEVYIDKRITAQKENSTITVKLEKILFLRRLALTGIKSEMIS
jgi:hypothetical protein